MVTVGNGNLLYGKYLLNIDLNFLKMHFYSLENIEIDFLFNKLPFWVRFGQKHIKGTVLRENYKKFSFSKIFVKHDKNIKSCLFQKINYHVY